MPRRGRRDEKPEFEFLHHPKESNYVLKNAPFGTTLTPSTRMKIVGSKPIYFIDDGGGSWDGETSPRPIRKQVAEKPNHIVPREVKAVTHQGYSTAEKDHFNSQLHSPRSAMKGISPYRVIPPIRPPAVQQEQVDEEHLGNKLQDKGIEHQQYKDNFTLHNVTVEQKYAKPQHFNDKEQLLRLLPRGMYLAKEPLRLGKEDEWRLLALLNEELPHLDGEKLKEIYLEMTSFDKRLSGWCYMQDLSYTLGHHQVFLSPDILRLVACQFVSAKEPGRINYEKILSFFGTAVRTSSNGVHVKENIQEKRRTTPAAAADDDNPHVAQGTLHEPRPHSDNMPTTYSVENQQVKPPSNDSETTKLMRLVEQQMDNSDAVVDFDSLMGDFRKMDPNHRQTLSAAQVKQIVYSSKHHLPLQESLIDQILAKCDHHGDGQYNWLDFIEFLERVQPRQTGLVLPQSKQPLEYAKHYGKPSTNWPYADEPAQTGKQDSRAPVATYTRDYNSNLGQPVRWTPYEEDGRVSQLEIERKQQQLTDMERELELMKCRVDEEKAESEPWFQRFLKLASAVYSQDIDHSGCLPYDEVKQLLRLYNDAYNLRLSEHVIDQAMMEHYSKGQVSIHDMLSQLGTTGSSAP